jgi:outer membrane protein
MRLLKCMTSLSGCAALLCGTLAGQSAAQSVQRLKLAEAEKIAIQNHPQIQAAADLASAAKAQVTEVRSAYFPTAYGSMTAADAENDSRVTAGELNNPIIYDRYANGVTVSQLITDFGRTHELVKSSNLHAQADKETVVTTRANILLGVDRAYLVALRAQAVLTVAQETVKERRLVADQVGELEKNKIKSGLDLSFANVDLAQAELLLLQAQNDVDTSYASLSAALGYGDERIFQLEEEPLPPAPPTDYSALLQQAVKNRPELISMRLQAASEHSYATAERDLWLPTISAAGAAGVTPYRADELSPHYAAAGVNVNIPIFNGHLYGALRSEANSRARAEDQKLRDIQNQIVQDVRTAWLNSNAAFQRIALTDQLLKYASDAMDLAQARYKLGLSSIIELSQAQLNLTAAELQSASAKYDYETQLSVLSYQTGALH